GRARARSWAPPETLGPSQGRTWARGLTHGGCRAWKIETRASAQGACRQRASYALGVSECGVLSKHRALSPDQVVPTYTPLAARRDSGREIGEARTGTGPVSIAPRGNGVIARTFAFLAHPRRSLSSAQFVTPAAAAKNARNSRRHPPGTCRTTAGALHR